MDLTSDVQPSQDIVYNSNLNAYLYPIESASPFPSCSRKKSEARERGYVLCTRLQPGVSVLLVKRTIVVVLTLYSSKLHIMHSIIRLSDIFRVNHSMKPTFSLVPDWTFIVWFHCNGTTQLRMTFESLYLS